MKLIVCGHKRHGKDFLCEHIEKSTGLSFASSSEEAGPDVFAGSEELQSKYGDWQEAHDNRDDDRPIWFDGICRINTPDKTTLATRIFEKHPVYCGMRNIEELLPCKEKWGAELLVVWVDASKRLPLESSSSNSITEDDCTFSIRNNRSKKEFVQRIKKVFWRLMR